VNDPSIERRALMHAALGEPVRLAIVDSLSVGDVSPGELGARFGLPTNLLAHHLRVLQEAGLIRRIRSEGDRRRHYVQLVLDDPAVTRTVRHDVPPFEEVHPRVLFVCTQNSARSQLAAAAWSRVSAVPTASAGTHPAPRVHPRAIRTGRRHGLKLSGRTAHVSDTIQPRDLVVAVCDNAHEELFPDPVGIGSPRLHWAVPDPARIDTDEAFEAAYQQIATRVDRLARAVTDPDATVPDPTHQ
jgi:protein-tyrosine-phosphatase/DNA-binding transcriptional ArsR family regulator